MAPRAVVTCSPEIAFSDRMRNYVESQRNSPRKQWIYGIIDGTYETENRITDTEDVVILPDTEVPNTDMITNWLAVFKDTSLHSIRDLRGHHVPLLKRVRTLCMDSICEHGGYHQNNVMIYLHYVPSIYQLHLHICAPYGQYTTPDVCKIHPIDTIISNLEIDPEYYCKVHITTAVVNRGELAEIYNSYM